MLERARSAVTKALNFLLPRPEYDHSDILQDHFEDEQGKLIASSRPDEINQMIARRKETLKAQKDRKGKQIDPPVFSRIVEGEQPGTTNIKFEYKGHEYSFTSEAGGDSVEGFIERLKEYLPKAPECTTCDRIIFPGENVGEVSKGFMHNSWECSPSGTYFVGRIDTHGKLTQAEWDITEGQYINTMKLRYPDDEELTNFYK